MVHGKVNVCRCCSSYFNIFTIFIFSDRYYGLLRLEMPPSSIKLLGTRFRPLSLQLPKPLFPIAGVPLIEHHIEQLSKVSCFSFLYIQKVFFVV